VASGGRSKSLRALMARAQRPMIILTRFFCFVFSSTGKNENKMKISEKQQYTTAGIAHSLVLRCFTE
jgi:hypothetical protein